MTGRPDRWARTESKRGYLSTPASGLDPLLFIQAPFRPPPHQFPVSSSSATGSNPIITNTTPPPRPQDKSNLKPHNPPRIHKPPVRLMGMSLQRLLRPPIHDIGEICKPRPRITRRFSSEHPPAGVYAYSAPAGARRYCHVRRAAATEAAERRGVAGA